MKNKRTATKQLRSNDRILEVIDRKLGFIPGNTLLISRATSDLLEKATDDEHKRIMQNAAAGIPMTPEEIKQLQDR